MDDFDFYRIYKLLHVLSVIVLGGGIAIESVIGPMMARAKTVQELRAYTRLARIAENYIILPSVIVAMGFGYATAGRLNIDLDTPWLLIAQVLTVIALVMGGLYLRSAANQVDKLATAAPDGPVPDYLAEHMKNPGPAMVGATLTLIFVFIVYLMVVKPNW